MLSQGGPEPASPGGDRDPCLVDWDSGFSLAVLDL